MNTSYLIMLQRHGVDVVLVWTTKSSGGVVFMTNDCRLVVDDPDDSGMNLVPWSVPEEPLLSVELQLDLRS